MYERVQFGKDVGRRQAATKGKTRKKWADKLVNRDCQTTDHCRGHEHGFSSQVAKTSYGILIARAEFRVYVGLIPQLASKLNLKNI